MTPNALRFAVRIDQNPNIAVGSRTVDAIVQVKAEDPEAGAYKPVAAEVIVIDTSASMTNGQKIDKACQAAAMAVEVLDDGTYFAVVSGQSHATPVYPPRGMAVASPDTRRAAARALAQVTARGGTSMSTWLRLTGALLADCHEARIKHALLLTDGQNIEGDTPLRDALRDCEGAFVCDCRGVGDDWSYEQLREISRTLLGSWKPVAAAEELADDFRTVMRTTMSKRAAGVTLQVRTRGRVSYLGRVMPDIEDLTGKGVRHGEMWEFPLGDWGAQTADYLLRIDIGLEDLRIKTEQRARAARVEVVVPGQTDPVKAGTVAVSWTPDVTLSSVINPRVAGYSGQEKLSRAVDEGLSAWKNGRADAEEKLGLVVRLAHELGREDLLERLSAIVVIENRITGRIWLRPRDQVSFGDMNWFSHLAGQSLYVEPAEPNEAEGAKRPQESEESYGA
jgi:hypothetical protein